MKKVEDKSFIKVKTEVHYNAISDSDIDFVIGNKQIEIHFFEEYSKAYKGLGDNDKEDFYLKKISELRKEI